MIVLALLLAAVLPGEELPSGFRFRPARDVPEACLSGEALRRVIEKMDSVDRARRRAASYSHSAVIGAARDEP